MVIGMDIIGLCQPYGTHGDMRNVLVGSVYGCCMFPVGVCHVCVSGDSLSEKVPEGKYDSLLYLILHWLHMLRFHSFSLFLYYTISMIMMIIHSLSNKKEQPAFLYLKNGLFGNHKVQKI